MLVVKVMQTGQASFSAARVALMGRHSGRSGSPGAHTPAALSSSHSSSPWDQASASGPARALRPESLPPSPRPCIHTFGDPAPLPDVFHSRISHPHTQGPQISTLRPCTSCFPPPARKLAGSPHPSRKRPPLPGHRTLPLPSSHGLDVVARGPGALWSYLEHLHPRCLPCRVYLVL